MILPPILRQSQWRKSQNRCKQNETLERLVHGRHLSARRLRLVARRAAW
jgi:hypothetical protein